MSTPPVSHQRVPSLRAKHRPSFNAGKQKIRVVDLFAGCGGLSLGIAQSARSEGLGMDVRLALDFEQAAVDVYKANFRAANVVKGSVEDHFNGALGSDLTTREAQLIAELGAIDILVGGPPCQGHSNLNNRTRRSDPKNELYLRMARATEVLLPKIVLIENVPSVRLDTARVVQTTYDRLKDVLNYKVATATVSLHALGVAQKRRRHVLLASRIEGVDPQAILDALLSRKPNPAHNLSWAIRDLEDLVDPQGYDVHPKASPENTIRMQYLADKGVKDLPNMLRPKCHQNDEHTYKSMYGRLSWSEPAQTITSGFGSIGQGRYMHPGQVRALTAHEAARIQGFPDYFDFSSVVKRADLATMIGNAVPPALMREVAKSVMPALVEQLGLEVQLGDVETFSRSEELALVG